MQIHKCDLCGAVLEDDDWNVGINVVVETRKDQGRNFEHMERLIECCPLCRVNFAAEVKALVKRMKKT